MALPPGPVTPGGHRRRRRPGRSSRRMRSRREQRDRRGDRLLEIFAVLLLGIATVGTAWCGYQAAQWNGAQHDLRPRSVRPARRGSQAVRARDPETQLRQQLARPVRAGRGAGNDKLPLLPHHPGTPGFPSRPRPVGDPATGRANPDQPVPGPEYLDAQLADYQPAVDRAAASTAASQQASKTADAYVATTILLAVALFFAGVTSRSATGRPGRC